MKQRSTIHHNRASKSLLFKTAVCGALLVSTIGLLPSPVKADLKIESQVNVIGLADFPGGQLFEHTAESFPQIVTVYYKGDKARTDTPGGPTTIYDSGAGKIYTLFPDKTFTVNAMKDFSGSQPDLFAQSGAPDQVKLDLSKTEDVPGDNQVIVGADAKKFLISGSLVSKPQQAPPRRNNGGGGGHHHGFGGFPGLPFGEGGYSSGYEGGDSGGYSRGSEQSGSQGPGMLVLVDGEVWLSDAARLPDGSKAGDLPLLTPAIFFSGPLDSNLSDQIKKTDEIPLYAKVTLTHRTPGADSSQSIVLTEQVQSLSSAPLPDSLFAIPQGYQQVATQPVVLSITGHSSN